MSVRRQPGVSDATAIDAALVYAVWFEVPEDALSDFDAWYEIDHVPLLLGCKDWLMIRRFSIVDGEPTRANRLALHYLAARSALDSAERAAARQTPWRDRMAPAVTICLKNLAPARPAACASDPTAIPASRDRAKLPSRLINRVSLLPNKDTVQVTFEILFKFFHARPTRYKSLHEIMHFDESLAIPDANCARNGHALRPAFKNHQRGDCEYSHFSTALRLSHDLSFA
jgi:hypothetical protein